MLDVRSPGSKILCISGSWEDLTGRLLWACSKIRDCISGFGLYEPGLLGPHSGVKVSDAIGNAAIHVLEKLKVEDAQSVFEKATYGHIVVAYAHYGNERSTRKRISISMRCDCSFKLYPIPFDIRKSPSNLPKVLIPQINQLCFCHLSDGALRSHWAVYIRWPMLFPGLRSSPGLLQPAGRLAGPESTPQGSESLPPSHHHHRLPSPEPQLLQEVGWQTAIWSGLLVSPMQPSATCT